MGFTETNALKTLIQSGRHTHTQRRRYKELTCDEVDLLILFPTKQWKVEWKKGKVWASLTENNIYNSPSRNLCQGNIVQMNYEYRLK